MKIISLKIKNLASLEGSFTIDFTQEPLASAGIFAITGPTGSGKSTLLDALCLGLYGKTPRYSQAGEYGVEVEDIKGGDKIKQNDVRAILRDGTAEGSSEVTFIGVDGHEYLATWSVRRARNRIDGSLQQVETKLFNNTTNTPLGGKKNETLAEIERVIGLNFEQFTRSVLLAQGDFTAFLKADKDAKASLLEKLTGTDIYSSISMKIYERYKEEKEVFNRLEAQKEGIHLLSEVELADFVQQQQTVDATILTIKQAIEQSKEGIIWYERNQSLELAVASAQQQLADAEANQQQAAPQIALLATVESLQPARTLLDACQNTEASLQQKNKEVSTKATAIATAQARLQTATQEYELAETKAAQADTDWKNAQPALAKAKELDALITEKSSQLVAAQQELSQSKDAYHKIVSRIEETQQLLDQQQLKANSLTAWKQQHSTRQPIADNIVRITTQLTHAASRFTQLQQLELEVNAKSQIIEKVQQQANQLAHQLQEGQLSLKHKRDTIEALQNQLQLVPFEALQQQETTLIPAIEATVAAKALWEKAYNIEQEVELATQRLLELQQNVADKSRQSVRLAEELQVATIKKEQTLALLNEARLQASANVQHLRSQLVNDQPCPVCGSLHHPFIETAAQPATTLSLLENAYNTCTSVYDQLLTASASMSEQVNQLQQQITKSSEELEQKKSQATEVISQWKALPLSLEMEHLPATERMLWLNNLQVIQRNELGLVQQQIKQYREEYNQLQQLKESLAQLEKQSTLLDNELKDKAREKASYADQFASLKAQEAVINQELAETINSLNPFFSKPNWVESWKQATQPFVDKLSQFAKEWEQASKQLEELAVQQQLNSNQLYSLQEQRTTIEQEKQIKEEKWSAIVEHVESLRQQRNLLFEGQPVEAVSAQLNATQEQAKVLANKLLQSKQQAYEQWLKCNAAETQLQNDIVHLNSVWQQQQQVLVDWLRNYNELNVTQETIDSLRHHLSQPQNWIAEKKKLVATIQEAITTAITLLNERTAQLTSHHQQQKPLLPEAVIREQLLASQQQIEIQNGIKAEIDFTLKTDKTNKQLVGDLVERMAIQAAIEENWAKLNEIIGSADGKKFRQIAQEYTLDILLGYANHHLQTLSTRYQLMRIPNSLGLQVIDTDMGNEVRTVYSLSGGESFLVSLALALGLASLSSKKMKVESLFIDEGFGTLDPLTLQIAMDALETLRNQGRKVGVISHVQEMTDRIATQIRVVKLSNGKSKVEVLNV